MKLWLELHTNFCTSDISQKPKRESISHQHKISNTAIHTKEEIVLCSYDTLDNNVGITNQFFKIFEEELLAGSYPAFGSRGSKLRGSKIKFTRIIMTTLYIDTARQVCFFTSFNVPIFLYE